MKSHSYHVAWGLLTIIALAGAHASPQQIGDALAESSCTFEGERSFHYATVGESTTTIILSLAGCQLAVNGELNHALDIIYQGTTHNGSGPPFLAPPPTVELGLVSGVKIIEGQIIAGERLFNEQHQAYISAAISYTLTNSIGNDYISWFELSYL
ncbi:hypothetical protein [Aeromonas finlandensis]|uniref:hypothetical protein n=1 Tax=Aeromonas finlandensis TaxID=1543375 RepID=UPI0012E0B26E|nr:hypothetical protein [Aeromonas finlandensis]